MKVLIVSSDLTYLNELEKEIGEVISNSKIFPVSKASEAISYMEEEKIDIVFIDNNIKLINNIKLAKKLKVIRPKATILFLIDKNTNIEKGSSLPLLAPVDELIGKVFKNKKKDENDEAYLESLLNYGYITKPIDYDKLTKSLELLITNNSKESTQHLNIKCFGDFEFNFDGNKIKFSHSRTAEFFAYLVMANGRYVNMKEIEYALFNDDKHDAYISNLKVDFEKTFSELDLHKIIKNKDGSLAIDRKYANCDFFDYSKGYLWGINSYNGKFMEQYSWAGKCLRDIEKGKY